MRSIDWPITRSISRTVAISSGASFWIANILVSVAFLALAATCFKVPYMHVGANHVDVRKNLLPLLAGMLDVSVAQNLQNLVDDISRKIIIERVRVHPGLISHHIRRGKLVTQVRQIAFEHYLAVGHIVAPHATRAAIAQNRNDSASTGQPKRRHRYAPD